MELVIDTSTSITGIALANQGMLIADFSWPSSRNQTVELLPEVNRMLQRENLQVNKLTGIVVARGPGGFSGLRVGLAFAKGLAYSIAIPIVGISTLEAIAWRHSEAGIPTRSILPAGRGEVYTSAYQRTDERLVPLEHERITSIDDLVEHTDTPTIFCGDIAAEQLDRLRFSLRDLAVFPEDPDKISRIVSLAWLGWCRIESGDTDDAATLQPVYLRKPSITRPGRR